MTQPKDCYIDIRIHVKETYDDDLGETYTEVLGVSFAGTTLTSYSELISVAESLAQVDRYQIMLANDIPNAVAEGTCT